MEYLCAWRGASTVSTESQGPLVQAYDVRDISKEVRMTCLRGAFAGAERPARILSMLAAGKFAADRSI